MTRGKGYKPDPAGHRRTPFAHLASKFSAVTVLQSATLLPFAPEVFDQGPSGGCVGHSGAGCATARLRHVGDVGSDWIASPDKSYRGARAIDRADASIVLTDDGAEPNQLERFYQTFGIGKFGPLATDGRYSDLDMAHVNDEPSLAELEADAVDVLVGGYGITDIGAARRAAIATSLSAGIPIGIAVDASDGGPLQSYTSGVLNALGSQLDHYVWILGYDGTDANMVVTVRNSWGAAFGESGNFRIAGAALDELGDMIAFDMRVA